MPDCITEPKTNKQKLMNSVIEFLTEMDCSWQANEESSVAISLVTALTDTLWIIDGHHHIFSSQGCRIPSTFSKFVGFNQPEQHKHRKRQLDNLSASVLQSMSEHLFFCLQASYWSRCEWMELKTDVESLAQCLSQYTDYLECSKKRAMTNHYSKSSVHEVAENINFQFLPVSRTKSSSLLELQSRLEQVSDFQYVAVEDVISTVDSRAKYNLIKRMKSNGFPFPTALLSYTHGNNVGNLHFIWKVPSADVTSFSESQKVIETIKISIPIFHTRAMRQEMFNVFGRVASSVKPAVLRHLYRVFTGECLYDCIYCC